MATPKTKFQLVKEHLIKHKSITSWEAIEKFEATRLSDIIFRLEHAGWKFSRTKVRRKEYAGTSSNYTRYILETSPKKELQKLKK